MDLLPFRINCADGVLESQESSLVPDGFLTECLNWIPEPTGGLRVRPKWNLASTNGAPATRRNVGIGMFSRLTTPTVVQQSSVYTNFSSHSTITPTVSWAVPTQAGNILVACIGWVNASGATPTTVTATGWTARQAMPASPVFNTPYALVYDLVSTQSYAGDVQPFVITNTTTGNIGVTLFILELSGVAAIDQTAHTAGSNLLSASSPLTVAATTSSTTQASGLALSWSYAGRLAPSSEVFTFSAPSTGWATQYEQTTYLAHTSGAGFTKNRGILHSKVQTAIGAVSQTLSTTFTNLTNDNNYLDVTVVAYKGWNDDVTPGARRSFYLAANDDGTNVDVYRIDREAILSGTWVSTDANVATSASAPIAFTLGLGRTWYTGSTFAGIRSYDGTSPATVSGSPVGAKCIAINHDRLWAASGTRLSFSQIGDGSTWSGRGTGWFDFGKDDGEDIEDITPFAGGMVVGKATTLYFLAGANTNEFQPIPLNAGGAAPGRSVLATPYGCVIAGREQVWLYDGQSVTPIGRGIENSYGVADGAYVSLSYEDGSIFIADGTSSYIFVFDINSGVWHKEKIGTLPGEAAAVLYNYGDTQLYGPVSSSTASLVGFRTFPGGDRGRDEGLPEIFTASTGDRWFAGPRQTITPRYLWLQTRQRDGDATETALSIDGTWDTGETEPTRHIEARTEGVYRDQRAISQLGKGKSSMKLTFSHVADEDEDVTYDIEAIAVDVERADAR